MISQKCPKCLSKRVRRGYRPTPFWSKLLFRYNLLCDNCNWEFTGFAVPGTVSAKPTKSSKKKQPAKAGENLSSATNGADANSHGKIIAGQPPGEKSGAGQTEPVNRQIDAVSQPAVKTVNKNTN